MIYMGTGVESRPELTVAASRTQNRVALLEVNPKLMVEEVAPHHHGYRHNKSPQ